MTDTATTRTTSGASTCTVCTGCSGANLEPLLAPHVVWVWHQLAATADRRGDADLVSGTATLVAPADPDDRAAVLGLLPGRPLAPGVRRRVDLGVLHDIVRGYGPELTPGAVAAHAVGRRLAVAAARLRDRADFAARLDARGRAWASTSASRVAGSWGTVFDYLQRTGWVARLWQCADGPVVFDQALAVIDALPHAGSRADRRVLAGLVASNPHALDAGEMLPALVLAMSTAAGAVPAGAKARDAWDVVGVDCDDLTGGLVAVGIHPTGWQLPPGAAVTLPPRVLSGCEWSPPSSAEQWVFVTENPSVASAAADLAASGASVRLLCTVGTPSATEVAAIARLARAGWRIAVRADFDIAGLAHVKAVLDAIPDALPWRMSADDYKHSLRDAAPELVAPVPDTPWDTHLADAMRTSGVAAFEETLLDDLLADLHAGQHEL